MNAPLQTIPVAPGRRPLMPFKTVMWAMYRDEDAVAQIVGERKVIAFNIACGTARKSHVVIWTASLVNYLNALPPLRVADAAIFADIFPGNQAAFPTSYLARLFTVGRSHITSLVADGSLKIDNRRKPGRGPGQTRHILRQSLADFFKERRIS